jgi:hypothetical protein
MNSREQYEYHKLLKFLYFEGYADSYQDAEYLLEELSDEELDELLEEYELNEAHTFPLSPEERGIVSRIAAINRGETPKKKTSTKSASKIEPSTSGPRRMGVQGVEYKEECDIILDHLLDEGYAETVESAEAIMVNMSEEWIDEILDESRGFGGHIDPQTGKPTGQRSPSQQAHTQYWDNVRRGKQAPDSRRSKFKYGGSKSATTGAQAGESPEDFAKKQDPGLAMTPAARMRARATSLKLKGKGRQANKIFAALNRPNMSEG